MEKKNFISNPRLAALQGHADDQHDSEALFERIQTGIRKWLLAATVTVAGGLAYTQSQKGNEPTTPEVLRGPSVVNDKSKIVGAQDFLYVFLQEEEALKQKGLTFEDIGVSYEDCVARNLEFARELNHSFESTGAMVVKADVTITLGRIDKALREATNYQKKILKGEAISFSRKDVGVDEEKVGQLMAQLPDVIPETETR